MTQILIPVALSCWIFFVFFTFVKISQTCTPPGHFMEETWSSVHQGLLPCNIVLIWINFEKKKLNGFFFDDTWFIHLVTWASIIIIILYLSLSNI